MIYGRPNVMHALGNSVVFNRASAYQSGTDSVRDMRHEYLDYENNLNFDSDHTRGPRTILAYLPWARSPRV